MNILSLFDGVSCARLALEKNNIPIDKYFASEVDKYAIKVTQANRTDTIQLGDVREVQGSQLPQIDLLIGGSPCQDLSIAKKDRKGLDGERSGLFWEYARVLKEVSPKYFILENVASMSKESKRIITEAMGVEPIMINAALVSAQNRKRLFWTNIPNVTQPEDRGILLKDILESGVDEKYYLSNKIIEGFYNKKNNFNGRFVPMELSKEKSQTLTSRYFKMSATDPYIKQPMRIATLNSGGQGDRIYSEEGKSVSLSANGGGRGAKTGLYQQNESVRKLTPLECERLQSMPDNWTNPTGDISNTQRYKMCGNAFNVDVVAHILSFIK